MPDPVVTNGNFSLTLPVTTGESVGAMTATNSPTSWSIIAGDPNGYYAIDNAGNITVTLSGASNLAAGTNILTVQATAAAIAVPTTPVLSLVSATTTAVFTIDVDNTIGAGDSVELQVQVTGGSWSPLVSDTVHTITAGEDAANQINLSLGLPNGSYDARAQVTDTVGTGLTSAWSNTVVNFTISGAVSTQIYFLAIEGF